VALKIADVELKALILTIRETKFFKTRLVPIGPDLGKVLKRYFQQQWSASPHTLDSPFLAAMDGTPVIRRTAEGIFTRLRKEAGVKGHDGSRYQPRLYDFRHRADFLVMPTFRRSCPFAPIWPRVEIAIAQLKSA
jgi:integrase/recombinase XerD